jgi:hypothetical protein
LNRATFRAAQRGLQTENLAPQIIGVSLNFPEETGKKGTDTD